MFDFREAVDRYVTESLRLYAAMCEHCQAAPAVIGACDQLIKMLEASPDNAEEVSQARACWACIARNWFGCSKTGRGPCAYQGT